MFSVSETTTLNVNTTTTSEKNSYFPKPPSINGDAT